VDDEFLGGANRNRGRGETQGEKGDKAGTLRFHVRIPDDVMR
jgi:hypothetical protein